MDYYENNYNMCEMPSEKCLSIKYSWILKNCGEIDQNEKCPKILKSTLSAFEHHVTNSEGIKEIVQDSSIPLL